MANLFISKKRIITAAFMLLSLKAHSSTLEDFYKYYKSAQYPKAIETLEDIKDQNLGSKAYLKGLCYTKLQEYDLAISEFELAIKEENKNADLYYEYGQSLYAANKLKKSRDAFNKSAEKNYNRTQSLYYVAHISQILEEYEVAKDTYTQVIKLKETDLKMKQIAQFQLAETLMALAREKSSNNNELTNRVDKYILPMLQRAYNLDKSSTVASDINQRTAELMQEFNLDPNMLINGRRINPKRYGASLSQKIKYDDNISLTNEENNVQQSKKESYIFETEVYGKYDFILKKRFIVSPEIRTSFTKHSDQSSPEVYQNDSIILNVNLKNKYEHKYKERPASFIFDIDYSRTFKDWHQRRKKDFYADSKTFTFGESISYFNAGDTTFKIKIKDYTGKNTSISNNTTALSVDQTVFLPTQHLLIALLEINYIDNFNNTSSNTDTYMLRFDYLMPEIFPQYTLGIAMATTMTDTLDQKDTRGTEFSYNPSLDLSKDITKNAKMAINYDFTKSKSKSASYSYSKNVVTTEFRYSF